MAGSTGFAGFFASLPLLPLSCFGVDSAVFPDGTLLEGAALFPATGLCLSEAVFGMSSAGLFS